MMTEYSTSSTGPRLRKKNEIPTNFNRCLLYFLSLAAFAEDSLTIFKAGDTVKAAEINANFELIRAAAADAVSFEGLEDVYEGIVSETEEVSSTQAQSSVPTASHERART
jgi:hypothetical protein